jgi:hypothetical protein
MHPDISEFSYGYALTESLISAAPIKLRVAPIFPSLIEEGKPGGGYDVSLPFAGFPLFLQFKLSHRMVRDSADEVKKGVLQTPFYRMHIRPTRHSQQHPMLLDLESTGVAVYYAAPYFHKPDELNQAYTTRQVVQRSIFVKPSTIGALPDDKDHHIAFRRGSPSYFCSDSPRAIRESEDEPREFIDELARGFWQRERIEPTEASANEWADRVSNVVSSHQRYIQWLSDGELSAIRDRNPLVRLAYLARTFLGCNVVVVAPSEAQQ